MEKGPQDTNESKRLRCPVKKIRHTPHPLANCHISSVMDIDRYETLLESESQGCAMPAPALNAAHLGVRDLDAKIVDGVHAETRSRGLHSAGS